MLLVTMDPVEKPLARSVAHPMGPVTQEYSMVSVEAVTCPVPKRWRRPPGAISVLDRVSVFVRTDEKVAAAAVTVAAGMTTCVTAGEEMMLEMISTGAVKVEAPIEDATTRVAARGVVYATTGVTGPA